LVENPSTRSFVVAQDCPTRGQHRELGNGSLSVDVPALKSRSVEAQPGSGIWIVRDDGTTTRGLAEI
jgi:hypothetical protein